MSDALNYTRALDGISSALRTWSKDLGHDAGDGFRKLSRLVTLGLYRETSRGAAARAQSIAPNAKRRGFRMASSGGNEAAARWRRSVESARGTLGSSPSGYFRIQETDTGPVASPVVVGRKGRVIRTDRKWAQRGSLLTDAERQLNNKSVPAGAVRLNLQALAVVRQLKTRGRAARGSTLAVSFLTYRRMKGKAWRDVYTVTKNRLKAGEVSLENGANGAIKAISIKSMVPGAARHLYRIGAVGKAIDSAQGQFERDINEKLAQRFRERMGEARRRIENAKVIS